MPKTPLLLDCTLRDGGYYNNWDFPPEILSQYLTACLDAGVGVVEVGFRTPSATGYRGPFAYTTDGFLKRHLPDRFPDLAVMVNAKDLLSQPAVVRSLFARKTESPVSVVRIAAHLDEVISCRDATLALKDLGYRVGFNFMQSAGKPLELLRELAGQVADFESVDVLYVADSLGDMDAAGLDAIIGALREEWDRSLGFHGHDNTGQALANSLHAISSGVTWVDATLTGMGRGAGNCETELLLVELERRYPGCFSVGPLFELVQEPFSRWKREFGWGASLLYHLAARRNVHPTYAQEMVKDGRYSMREIAAAIEHLGSATGDRFSRDSLREAVAKSFVDPRGTSSVAGWAEGRDVLLLANTPSLQQHLGGVEDFIARKKPLVFALNYNAQLNPTLVDAFVACHPTRLLGDAVHYANSKTVLVAPLAATPLSVREQLSGSKVIDFGMRVAPGALAFSAHGITAPAPMAAAYAFGLAAACGARRVLLAGFEGYRADDSRHLEMVSLLNSFRRVHGAPQLLALTPTHYPIEQASLYDPAL